MQTAFQIPLYAWATVTIIMTAAWIWGRHIHNYSVVDMFWAFCFLIPAFYIYTNAEGWQPRVQLICVLTGLWSIRLSTHLSLRILGHLEEEEGRYKQLRQDWAKNVDLTFFFFFQAQALSVILLSLPFFISSSNSTIGFSIAEIIGSGIWAVSICGETIADFQLQQFKQNKSNKGKVCNKGLWRYSRHPNYFFQLMIWVGIFIFSLSSPWGWLAIICPVSIAYLLFRVTGIPMNEEQNLRSKPEAYRKYMNKTSRFIPLPPKN